MDVRDLLRALRRFWALAALIFGLCVLGGALAVLVPDEKYTATATVIGTPATAAGNLDYASLDAVRLLLPSIASQVGTTTFENAVRASLPAEAWAPGTALTASTDVGTSLVRLSAESTSPSSSQAVANAAAEQLVRQDISSLIRIRVLDPAQLPTSPSSPRTTLILFAATAFGLITALLAAVGANAVRKHVRTPADVRRRFALDVIGEIPARRRRPPRMISQVFASHSEYADLGEAFQQLKTNIEIVAAGRNRIAITSCNPGEGKSTVTAGLAWALASMGEQVLVVDADLRRPSQHDAFQIDPDPGLADIPFGADVGRIARRTDMPGLRVVPAGFPSRHPTTIIHDALQAVLDSCEADYMLVDTPPMLSAAETTLVTTMVKSVLLVIDARRGNPDQLEQVLHELDRAGADVLGVVMNRTKVKRFRRGSPYYYPFSPPAAATPARRRVRA